MTLGAKKNKLLTSSTSASKENTYERLKQTFQHPCDPSARKQNQEQCFFLPSSYWKYLSSLVLIFMFDIVFKFIQWPGQLAEGVWEFAENTVLGSVRRNWHQRTHSYLCGVKTTLSVAFFISEVNRAGLQPAPLPNVARGTVWNGMRRQCREPRSLSVPLSSVDATLPSSRIPAN